MERLLDRLSQPDLALRTLRAMLFTVTAFARSED